MNDIPAEREASHRLTLLRRSLAVVATVLLTTVIALIAPAPAIAGETGPGFQRPGHPLDHLGGYRTGDGTIAYCIDIGQPSTVGAATTDAGRADQVNGLDAAAMRRLNVVLSMHGTTDDPIVAAAVAMVVWSIADGERYAAVGGDAAVLQRAPAPVRASIQALADSYRAESAAYPSTPTPAVAPTLHIDDGDDYSGSLTMTLTPVGGSAAVELDNAVFADTGERNREAISNGEVLPIRAIPPATSPYRVSVSATTTALGGPPAAVRLFTTPGAQSLVASAAPTTVTASATAADERDRRVPTVATIAQPTAVVGGTISDTATVAGIPGTGALLEWAAYRQPAGSDSPVCTDAERIYASEPTRITADGSYPSDPFTVRPEHVGTVFWVATVTVEGTPPVADECGAPTERSTIVAAPHLPVVSG